MTGAVTARPRPRFHRLRPLGRVFFHHYALLVWITLLGGALRFWKLTEPALWGDEVHTYRRVFGTFQELVDLLARGGFTPLHYLLYYWIGKHHTLTPFVMRLPVAIAGMLMTPAMYFLARQLVPRPVALLTALLTACSAYMLNFSRDAKMYPELWLMCTLHMASLLWWLRTRSRLGWWCWVCSGTAMLGVQLIGAALLPIELLIVVTAPRAHWRSLGQLLRFLFWLPAAIFALPLSFIQLRYRESFVQIRRFARRHLAGFRWPTLVLFLLGVAALGAAPAVYYTKFNQYFDRVFEDDRSWAQSGIHWIAAYNTGRQGADLLRMTASAFAYNWEWATPAQMPAVAERTRKLLIGSGVVLLALGCAGALPWTRRAGSPSSRKWLWLSLWIVLPAYAFYCASIADAQYPIDWIGRLLLRAPPQITWPPLPIQTSWDMTWKHWRSTDALRVFVFSWHGDLRMWARGFTVQNLNFWPSVVLALLACWWFCMPTGGSRKKIHSAARFAAIVLANFVFCWLVRFAVARPFPGSVWIPRYLGFTWPAVCILMALLLWRLPTRPLRWAGVAIVLLINLSQFAARVLAGSEPPTELMASDIIASQPPLHSRLFSSIPVQDGMKPGTGELDSMPARYYLAVLSGKPPQAMQDLMRTSPNILVGRPRFFAPLNAQVAAALKADASINQLIVWDQLKIGQVDTVDRLAPTLPPGWRCMNENEFTVRDHWTWTDYSVDRRRVYQRK